jgi:D-alanyl-lipoteichoic acid acyltransferase DltB (MBOAT superfamily)
LRIVCDTLPALVACTVLCVIAFQRDWSAVPFLLEHCCKVVLTYFTTVFLGNFSAALWRLAGGTALDPMNNPALGSTPAMFWRRWNQPARQFFYHYVFLPSGGVRTPVRATLVTFFVSGLVHEYVFGIAANWIQGWQLVFFMLQGCAAAATLRVQPQKHAVPAWIAGTVLFNLVTSVFFFKSVDVLFPFYSSRN